METKKILIVDDETKVCEIIGKFLKAKGFEVAEAYDGAECFMKCSTFHPDLVLLDVRMPKVDGIEALKRIKKDFPDIEVIMTTAVGVAETIIPCMKAGAYGYQMKPLNLESLLWDINKALEHRKLVLENKDYQANLEEKVEKKTKEVKTLHKGLKESFLNTVKITLGLVDIYDPFLGGHSRRVVKLAQKIAVKLNFSEQELFDLELAGLLHEIGMVAVPDKLKTEPFRKLNESEIEIIEKYPIFSQQILLPSHELGKAGIIIRHHLEHIDGSGFPDGLKGESIPIGSRILGLVNAYDEISMRRRFSKEEFPNDNIKEDFVLTQLRKQADKYYEAGFIDLLETIIQSEGEVRKTKELLSVFELEPGMIIAADIYTRDGRLLLSEGHMLSHIHVLKIQNLSNASLLDDKFYVYEKLKRM